MAGVASAIAIVALGGTIALWPKQPQVPHQMSSPPLVTVPADRSLSYSLIVKPPSGPARPMAREMVFPPKYRVTFNFTSKQDGFLYLVNQAPATKKGITWIWLSPDPKLNGGSAALTAGQKVSLPSAGDGFLLDEMQGTELVYVIWSDKSVQELETIKAAVFARKHQSELSTSESATLQTFIQQHSANVVVDKGETETKISGKGPVFVRAIPLEHL